MRQSLYDSLRFPPVEIAKLYLRNDLAIALELACEINGVTARYAALVVNVPLEKVGRKLKCSCRCDDEQVSVLVDTVEVMNDIKHRIERVPAVVGLKVLDQAEDSRVSDATYFSFVSAEHFCLRWPFFENREFDKFFIPRSVFGIGELPDDVIEARSQVVVE